MAAELAVPTDQFGIPLAIAVPDELDDWPSNDHHAHHPKSDPRLQDLDGKALVSSRIQRVPDVLHNYGTESYHAKFILSDGLFDLLSDRSIKFRNCLLGGAGWVATQGIDVMSDNPERPVDLTPTQIERLRTVQTPREVTPAQLRNYVRKYGQTMPLRKAWRRTTLNNQRQASFSYHYFRYNYDPLKDFFRDYLIEQGEVVGPRLMKRFLAAKDPQKRLALGDTILSQTADYATIAFRGQYRALHEAGLLHPRISDQPDRLVFHKLGTLAQRATLLPSLHEKLEASLG